MSERSTGDNRPVALVSSPIPHRPYPHKTTDREQFTATLSAARSAGADDGVMETEGGFVAECAIWGVFWWEGDRLCGPPLELGILPGVARMRLEEVAGGIAERRVRREDLEGLSFFVANAVRGVVPVATFDRVPVPQHVGTSRLSSSFWP